MVTEVIHFPSQGGGVISKAEVHSAPPGNQVECIASPNTNAMSPNSEQTVPQQFRSITIPTAKTVQ
jgi:hypothetical protein